MYALQIPIIHIPVFPASRKQQNQILIIDRCIFITRKSGCQVEDLLKTVEKLSNFQIPYPHRVKIFKALRMRWFNDPKRVKTYFLLRLV